MDSSFSDFASQSTDFISDLDLPVPTVPPELNCPLWFCSANGQAAEQVGFQNVVLVLLANLTIDLSAVY